MKKDFLNQMKATVLSKEQLKTVTGTYGESAGCGGPCHCESRVGGSHGYIQVCVPISGGQNCSNGYC